MIPTPEWNKIARVRASVPFRQMHGRRRSSGRWFVVVTLVCILGLFVGCSPAAEKPEPPNPNPKNSPTAPASNGGPSVSTAPAEDYCSIFIREAEGFRHRYASVDPDTDPLMAMVIVLGTPQELAILFDRLYPVAEEEIRPDLENLRRTMQRVSDDLGKNAEIRSALSFKRWLSVLPTQGSVERFDRYTLERCGDRFPQTSEQSQARPSPASSQSAPAERGLLDRWVELPEHPYIDFNERVLCVWYRSKHDVHES